MGKRVKHTTWHTTLGALGGSSGHKITQEEKQQRKTMLKIQQRLEAQRILMECYTEVWEKPEKTILRAIERGI